MSVGPWLGCVAIVASVWAGRVAAQDPSWPESRWYLSAGIDVPRGDLPRRDTPWGSAEGRFTAGPAVWLDGVFPGRGRPVRVYVQGLLAVSSTRWKAGSGGGASGLVGSATSGVEAGLTMGAVRPYARLGFGASVHLLGTGGDCIPESPTCGLASTYAGNVVDPALQASAGLEMRVGDRTMTVTGSGVWSEFEIRDGARSLRFLSFGVGLGL